MIEIIDTSSKCKMMAMVMANIKYDNSNYIVYCIDRGRGDANIFVSKLVITSDGYTFNNKFKNGEKEFLDGVVKRVINKEKLDKDGFVISNDIELSDINYFDIDKCYVSTISKKHIKDIMVFYKLITKKTLERPIVEIVDDEKFFNDGFLGNIFLILFGVGVIIFCISVVVGVLR